MAHSALRRRRVHIMAHICSECDKSFDRRFNMLRHKAAVHNEKDEEEEYDSDSESDSDSPVASSSEDEDSSDTAKTKENGEDRYDLWEYLKQSALKNPYIQEEMDQTIEKLHDPELSDDVVHAQAFRVVKPDVFKHVCRHYAAFLKLWHFAKNNTFHKKVMKTKRKLMDKEEFEPEEAIDYAVKKRKYIIEKATGIGLFDDEPLEEKVPPPIAESDEDGSDEVVPPPTSSEEDESDESTSTSHR